MLMKEAEAILNEEVKAINDHCKGLLPKTHFLRWTQLSEFHPLCGQPNVLISCFDVTLEICVDFREVCAGKGIAAIHERLNRRCDELSDIAEKIIKARTKPKQEADNA